MKRFLNIVVAVVTCICVLIANTIPAFATEIEDPFIGPIEVVDVDGDVLYEIELEDFDIDEFVIPYDVYLDASSTPFFGGILGFTGLTWGAVFAELGLFCTTGGLFMLGYLLCDGSLVSGLDGFLTDLIQKPVEFFNFVSSIFTGLTKLDSAHIDELETAFTSWVAGEAIKISLGLSQATAGVINDMTFISGSDGILDSNIIVDASLFFGIIEGAVPSSIEIGKVNGAETNNCLTGGIKNSSVDIDVLTFTNAPNDTDLTIVNNVTNATVVLRLREVLNFNPLRRLSDFYKVIDPESGAEYFIQYYSSSTFPNLVANGSAFLPSSVSSAYPISFLSTGTELDGQTIVSVAWNSATSMWEYTSATGGIHSLTMDPIGMILSKTVSTGIEIDVDAKANEDDESTTLPYVPPIADTQNPSIGVPVVDGLLTDALTGAISIPKVEVAVDAITGNLTLDSPDSITAFVGNLINLFAGIFDWLPEDFSVKLDGVIATFQTLIVLMVAAKIIDILWP